MKMFSHLWQYLDYFFLEWETFQIKLVQKMKTHILCPVIFFGKSCRVWNNAEKYGAAKEDANNIGPASGILDK